MQCTLPNVTNGSDRKSGFFMQALQTRAWLATAHLSSRLSARIRACLLRGETLPYIHPRFLNTTYSSVLSPTIASTASG
jgi:hypothetical protein